MYKLSYYNFYFPISEKETFVIYNSFHNSLFEIDPKLGYDFINMELYKNRDIDLLMIPPEELDSMINEGFIVSSDTNEKEDIINLKDKFREIYRKKDDSLSLTILLTSFCNLACKYCFEGINKPKKCLTNDVFSEIYNYIEDEIHKGVLKNVEIIWYGGEPLIEIIKLEEYSHQIIDLCNKSNVNYSSRVVTNGVNLTPKVIKILENIKIDAIQVTIDGDKETHNSRRPFLKSETGSFEMILNNLKHLTNKKIRMTIRINSDKIVFPSISKLLSDLIERDIWPKNKYISIYMGKTDESLYYKDSNLYSAYEFSEAEIDFEKLVFEVHNNWAKVNKKNKQKFVVKFPMITHNLCRTYNTNSSLVIDPYGNISKCWEHVNNPEVIIGNVRDRIEKVLKSKRNLDIINCFSIPEECLACKIYPICDECFCPSNNSFAQKSSRRCRWKYQLGPLIRYQFTLQIDHPELIDFFEND